MTMAIFIEQLDKNTNDTLEIAKSCSPSELTFKQDGKWSILEILEHIYMTDRIIHVIVSRPSNNLNHTQEIIGNEKIRKIMVDLRGDKIVSPERLKPKGDIHDVATFEKTFFQQRELLKQEIRAGKIVIDNRIHMHLFLGEMTISDWLNFIVHHTYRHLEQIKDILALKVNGAK
jgi:hypothetical protein